MKSLLTALVLALGLFHSAHAATPCPQNAVLSDDFFKKYIINITFNSPITFKKDSALHFIKSDSKWKRYWGKAIRIVINHNRGSTGIEAGQTLDVRNTMHIDGDLSGAFSSELNTFTLSNNSAGVNMIQVYSQPFSGVKVKALQKVLGATLYCKEASGF